MIFKHITIVTRHLTFQNTTEKLSIKVTTVQVEGKPSLTNRNMCRLFLHLYKGKIN